MGNRFALPGSALTRPTELLAAELAKKVRRHGIVVWDDRECRYAEVARSIAPPGASFAAYDGSWFALRRGIEPLLSQPEPPALVVYVPAKAAEQDPLEEVRKAGTSWSITLDHLLHRALDGELAPARIDALVRQVRTLAEAERALDEGGATDARLVTIFGTADVLAIAVDVLAGSREEKVESQDAWGLVAETLGDHLAALGGVSACGSLRPGRGPRRPARPAAERCGGSLTAADGAMPGRCRTPSGAAPSRGAP
jgi:hypothetical protein